ncbi:hypothetical protein AUR04nite_11180 [Glutamicibacter uratoxydans]|uniref:Gram-positive cocci surface proteins LPxTG domain-containing protein n=1 Tax=Glutamicibacter uratoxydans TaxID=43667 RepID=A0A4Y4DKW1_GLUUR|nr:hypothetical protein [Glutamicibacter uratoxydans]GED05586.1 hypothetical protein AUR04nite_11180 [Glutamicibacter uratoxydans]
MSPKASTSLLSAAVISGMLLAAAPAQAAETETVDQSVTSGVAETSAGTAVVENAAQPVLDAAPVDTAPAAGETVAEPAAPAEQDATEEPGVEPAQDEVATEEAPAAEDEAGQDAAASDAVDAADETELADEPAVVDDATDVQEETPAEPKPATDSPIDALEDEEVSEQDLDETAFWEDIADRLPEGSEQWDDTQWEEFFATDEGRQVQFEYIAFLLDNVSDAEYEELLGLLEENFDDEWLDAFARFYFGEDTDEETGTDGTEQKPTESEKPVETKKPVKEKEAEIQPAGNVDKKPVAEKKDEAKPQASNEDELADTGFDSLAVGGLGALLALSGAFVVAQRRKNATK